MFFMAEIVDKVVLIGNMYILQLYLFLQKIWARQFCLNVEAAHLQAVFGIFHYHHSFKKITLGT